MSRTGFGDVLNLICNEIVRTDADVGESTGPVDFMVSANFLNNIIELGFTVYLFSFMHHNYTL
jgi:hypothetical protein